MFGRSRNAQRTKPTHNNHKHNYVLWCSKYLLFGIWVDFLGYPLVKAGKWCRRCHDAAKYRPKPPKPLPRKRPRRLSESFYDQGTYQDRRQTSPLLNLPFEIRLMIYEYVFEKDTTVSLRTVFSSWQTPPIRASIELDKGMMKASCNCTYHFPAWHYTSESNYICARDYPGGIERCGHWYCPCQDVPVYWHHHRTPRAGHGFNLSLACRQLYLETKDLLYSSRRFMVDMPLTLLYFKHTLLPQRFASIKDLTLHWGRHWPDRSDTGSHRSYRPLNFVWATQFDRNWLKFWDTVRDEMVGLRRLHVHMIASDLITMPARLRIEESWVRPMLNVRGLAEFRLTICESAYHPVSARIRIVEVLEEEVRKIVTIPRD